MSENPDLELAIARVLQNAPEPLVKEGLTVLDGIFQTEAGNVLVRGGTACENLTRTYDRKPLVIAPQNPVPVPQHCQSIEFRDIVFNYEPKQVVLKRVQLKIPFGQSIAIVGGNGSGKSTVCDLLKKALLFVPSIHGNYT